MKALYYWTHPICKDGKNEFAGLKSVKDPFEDALGSILPTFYKQLLCTQIPKAQKDSHVISVFLRVWDLRL